MCELYVSRDMKNRYDILEMAPQVSLDSIHSLLKDFITFAVVKDKRSRWLELAMSPRKLYSKFNGLWNSLDTSKAVKMTALELPPQDYIYYCMDEIGYTLSALDSLTVGEDENGFLFDKHYKQVYFLTHEGEYYLYNIPKLG